METVETKLKGKESRENRQRRSWTETGLDWWTDWPADWGNRSSRRTGWRKEEWRLADRSNRSCRRTEMGSETVMAWPESGRGLAEMDLKSEREKTGTERKAMVGWRPDWNGLKRTGATAPAAGLDARLEKGRPGMADGFGNGPTGGGGGQSPDWFATVEMDWIWPEW